MSYHIYQTEGFVLGSRDFGESNRLFYILTKDIGLITVSAQGVRELKSKLRFSLQDFGLVRINTVKGRGIWRLTNAESIIGAEVFSNQNEKLVIVARIFSLLRRLIHGEEENEQLFYDISQFMDFIRSEKLSTEELKSLEIIINLKVLHHLGYGADVEALTPFLSRKIDKMLLSEILSLKRVALVEINKALEESQL